MLIFFGSVFLLCAPIFAYYSLFSLPPTAEIESIPPVSTKILDRDGKLLYEIYGEAKRTPVGLSDISPYMRQATVAAEDKDFYNHGAISFSAVLRAAWKNYKAGAIVQGGSTITQQVIKNVYLNRNKSFYRKFKEMILAQHLERNSSKDEILGLYLNVVPYGRNAYGVEAASQSYFGKSAKDLDLAESAYLAALPRATSYYNPLGPNFGELKQRQHYILDVMRQQGYISDGQLSQAKSEQVNFSPVKTAISAPYFVEWIKQGLIQKYGLKALQERGFSVFTSLDSELQGLAEKAVQDGVKANTKRYGVHNASLVAIDPKTGQVLAMVGGKDYFGQPEPAGCVPGKNCQFDPKVNVALMARQPGSSFKPYTYVTAFSPGFGFAPASIVADIQQNFSPPGIAPYIPRNFDGRSHGLLSMRRALAGSLNIAAVKTLSMVGVQNVIDTARSLGITTPLSGCGLSLTLGACEVRLLDHTAAYAVFANEGRRVPVTGIIKIMDKTGKVMEDNTTPQAVQVLNPEAVYELVDVLSDNNARSFIFGSRSPLYFSGRPVAAKTGTSQDFRDAWTMGFTPQLVVGVWAGNNDSSPMGDMADGVFVAAPIWHSFMAAALKDKPVVAFNKPDGIKNVLVSASSGKLATPNTVDPIKEVFAEYAVPTAYDPYKPPEEPTTTVVSEKIVTDKIVSDNSGGPGLQFGPTNISRSIP